MPASRTQAPAIAGLQSGKANLHKRSRKIVAPQLGEGKELSRDLDADGVDPEILCPGVATAGTIKAGTRGERADLELLTENIALNLRHVAPRAGSGGAKI